MNSIKVKSGKLKRNGSVAILICFFNNAESLIKQNSQAVFGRIRNKYTDNDNAISWWCSLRSFLQKTLCDFWKKLVFSRLWIKEKIKGARKNGEGWGRVTEALKREKARGEGGKAKWF